MKNGIYFKLAVENLKKSKKIYLPFIMSCVLSIFLMYSIDSLSIDPAITNIIGGGDLQKILSLGFYVIMFFTMIFLYYTNSFIIKNRKKELGVLSVLGMEKKHISFLVAFEFLFLYLISILFGIVFGLVLNKLFYLSILKILSSKVELGFYFSIKSITRIVFIFGFMFFIMYLNSIRHIITSNPIDLFKDQKAGEKEPRARLLLSLVGLTLLGAGYYIAIRTKSPLLAFNLFFIAVILVIVGTYILFIAGSVTFLKALKKNKNYYYKPKNFISLSSLIYRMKNNALGIASISILATMVLVVLATTTSVYKGLEDSIEKRYPKDVILSTYSEDRIDEIEEKVIKPSLGELNIEAIDYKKLHVYEASIFINDGQLEVAESFGGGFGPADNLYFLTLIDVNSYNKYYNSDIKLNKDEIIVYTSDGVKIKGDLRLGDLDLKIKDYEDKVNLEDLFGYIPVSKASILVDSKETFEKIGRQYPKGMKDSFVILFDTNASSDKNIALSEKMLELKRSNDLVYYDEVKDAKKSDFIALYGGLIFVGVFLSVMFMFATALTMYYKQVSEGYEDRRRFTIMKRVGLENGIIKKSINSQILLIFFSPLLVACTHLLFAFPLVKKLLELLMVTNTKLIVICFLFSILVFSSIYLIIYKLTSKVYYKTVTFE